MLKISYFLLWTFLCIQFSFSEISNSNQDTYLNALQDSHQTNVADREDTNFHSTGYDYQPPPNYAPPPPIYGPPAPVYGPPKPIYGPPVPPPFYLPALHHPRDEHWFFDKFKFKLNLFTIGKILLKLIIFKKIIKFVALICLLLFLPKLKHLVHDSKDDEADSMEMRSFSTDRENLNQRINDVTTFALTAFETFSKKYEGCERDQIWCRFKRMFDTIDRKYSYDKIVKLYIPNAEMENST